MLTRNFASDVKNVCILAIQNYFFKDTLRYVDYNKCKGCLKCVDVCEHNAIEVISMEDGQLIDFEIDSERCTVFELPLPKGSGFVIHRELLLNLLIQ